jgi:nucleoid-associated protein EbfC
MSSAFGDMGNLLKQAQKMQRDLELAREELKNARVTGTAGGGVVSLDADGDGQVLAVRIQPSMLGGAALGGAGDPSLLEDLVLAAARDAFAKAAALRQERLSRISGGLNLPGLY